MGRNTKSPLGSLQGMGDEHALAGVMNMQKMCLNLVANTREISVDEFRIDVGRLERDVCIVPASLEWAQYQIHAGSKM